MHALADLLNLLLHARGVGNPTRAEATRIPRVQVLGLMTMRLFRAVLPSAAPAALLRRHVPAAAAWAIVPQRKLSSVDIPIPELGAESIVEGGILSLAKKPGDFVAEEEMVAEIETGTHFFARLAWFYLQQTRSLMCRSRSLPTLSPL